MKKNQQDTNPVTSASPSDSCAFLSSWSQLDASLRPTFLYKLGPKGLVKEMGNGNSAVLLGEVFEALLNFEDNSDELILTVELLQALTTLERFAIIACFLSSTEHAACRKLFQRLTACFVEQKKDLVELNKLEKLFLFL